MKREPYIRLTARLIAKAVTLSDKKSQDYATADVLSNFKRISSCVKSLDLSLDTPTNYALFMVILKVDRIVNLLKQDIPPKNESIEDSFIDAINYLLLAYAGNKEKNENRI